MPQVIHCRVEPNGKTDPLKPVLKIETQSEIEQSYSAYLSDESRLKKGNADILVFPESEFQVSDFLYNHFLQKNHITISSARTGLVGGAVPSGGLLISLEKMNKILDLAVQKDSALITVQPGITLNALTGYLDKHASSWFYPPDPTEKTASIGGNVATNASGSRSLKYGQTRAFVRRIRVVLVDGTVIEIKRGDHFLNAGQTYLIEARNYQIKFNIPEMDNMRIKNTAGYAIRLPLDLIDLFIGSEGTLGLITEIDLNLLKKPVIDLAAVSFFKTELKALEFVLAIKQNIGCQPGQVRPTAIEYFDPNTLNLLRDKRSGEGMHSGIPEIPVSAQAAVYFEQECDESNLETFYNAYDTLLQQFETTMDETWGGMTEEEIGKLNHFRHAVPETVNMIIGLRQKEIPELHKISTDFVVPDQHLRSMMECYWQTLKKSKIQYVIFGHIGENHLHVNMIPSNVEEIEHAKSIYAQLAGTVVSFGGSLSGEHGIGRLKKHLLREMYTEKEISDLHSIKCAFDPSECLENGVLF